MKAKARWKAVGAFLVAATVAGCAGMEELLSPPEVSLTNVQVTALDFSGQTFRLGFAVSNPNPFPLPVTSIRYGVELDGLRFATGETEGGFTVPANGDGDFAINVRLDLLKSAPQLLYTVKDSLSREIPYVLTGSLGVNIPFAKPVRFESAGAIRLDAHAANR